MTATPARWEAPEVVDPPTFDGLRRFYDRLRRVTGLRTSGWMALAAGALALALGLGFGWLEFTVAGVLAVVTVGLCLLFTIGRPTLEVGLRLAGRAVVVGDPARGELMVRNAAPRRHWGSRLDLPVGPVSTSFSLPSLVSGAVSHNTFRIPTDKRGLVTVGPAQTVQGDPFALAGRSTTWTEALELYVHPRTVRLPGRQAGFVHDLEGHASSHISSADMNFHALRPYVAGDDRRHVHWRSTARAGELMVRQFEESRMSRVVVALDTGRGAYLDDAEFELAVSCAASVALQTLYSESPLAVLTTHETLMSVTPTRTLDELSLVGQSTRGGIADLVHTTIRREASASVAVCITGSTATLADLRRSCARFDVDTRVVGIRVADGAELRARSASNVTVLQVGTLDELPRAMRKAMQ
ncbi:DUF58 domain-containing protein [Tessaracoccus sp. MC1865]|uniref:DUF58 domain-containing protein n=1 Tax=Tessaracoccus sp. MC1865 TaxID=2760310 RepID=UPI001601D20D|nr:DUF58 domain-containing protein [Tessaracoccus sp. MC1865]MBB1482739.1 DUF58 domain-containing protein [Tessaracoccus sp. MC1865]QTO37813.1 DUF58 domain-containing protein [Tessaracoccus sp. MC1865]